MERKNALEFRGSGSTLFGLTIVNTLLTVITLGLYYPWAKVKYLQYYYQNTTLSGDHFSFHGTGKEMFIGFIKAMGFLIAVVALYLILMRINLAFLGILIYIVGLFLFIPIALHGTYRYRLAKTSWRSIHFGYRGNITELIKLCLKGFGLTLVTLGFYGSWFEMDLKKYLYKHFRLGSLKFNFTGNGSEYFFINLKGLFLTIVTLGIYSYWYAAEIFRYHYQNTEIEQNEKTYKFDSDVSGFEVFKLMFVNGLIIIFTLGLGFAWAKVREMKFIANYILIPEEVNADDITQTEDDYQDATGDSMFDFLDLGFII